MLWIIIRIQRRSMYLYISKNKQKCLYGAAAAAGGGGGGGGVGWLNGYI